MSALSIANVPPNSTYNITNNSLTNPNAIGLNIGTVDNPGMALTLENNTFDGSRWGAVLNNIQGPFSLSQTNSFAGAGHSGGYPVSISGVDVTVDGWTTLGVAGGGTGINVAIRSLRFSASNSQDIKITNNTINNPTQGVVMNSVVSATITGNTLTGTGGHPVSALSIANVPPNSTYNITNNSLTNPNAIGLNIGTVDNPGMALTLENNTFDGSRWGAVLNNIQGPFTLSQTNSFAGAGHSGGYPVSISGVDVTVDGWTTLGVAGGGTGINVAIRSLRFSASNSEDIKITNNTINNPTQGVVMNSVVSATITGNTLTGTGGHPVSALSIANVPPNSTYNITNNSLTNPNAIGLNIGTVDNPGIALTLENNTFDGSRWGAILNNIQGPFTLSQTNSFAGAGHSGGYPVSISGVDVTVDGWTTLGVAGGGTGINVAIRSHRFSSSNSQDINITNNTINNPTQGVVMNNVLSATITGNQLTGTGGHPVSALSIANVPGNSTYNITNNSLTNPTAIGLNIGTVDNPGMALTADGNTFDGSRFGAILNNIQGPFTLSTTNSFDGAGHSGGISLTISGVDLTVDGFAFSFATVEGGAGIAVGNRVHRFSASPSSGITISNTTVTGFGSGISASLLNNDLTLENVTACGNNQGIGIRSNGADVLGGNVEGNSVEGIRVFSGSTNVLIDGVNFFNNPAGKDVVDDTGAATVQNSTNNPFDCPPAVALTSIAVTPDPASVAVGSTIQFTATGTFSDDSTGDITDGTWSSSNPSVATIDAATGVATGVIMGTTNITAMKGTITSLTVTLNVFYTCMGLTATIVGTNGPDYIVGTTGDDVIASLGGDDVVLGMWGNDIICLGDGDDFGAGGDGKDKIAGEAGDDDLWGGARRDRLWGGTGNDLLRGGRGGDRLVGGSGDDVAFGGPGKDRHNCGAGYDFANGGPGTDTATASCEATWSIP